LADGLAVRAKGAKGREGTRRTAVYPSGIVDDDVSLNFLFCCSSRTFAFFASFARTA
jgi:hypothetical protein